MWKRLKWKWVPIVLPPSFGNVGMECSWEWIRFWGSKMRGVMGPGWLSHEARASLLGAELSLPLSCGKQVYWRTTGMFLTALVSVAESPGNESTGWCQLLHPTGDSCPDHRTPLLSGQAPGCSQDSDSHPVVVSAQILLQQSPWGCSLCP